jgi:hypothetical protein
MPGNAPLKLVRPLEEFIVHTLRNDVLYLLANCTR